MTPETAPLLMRAIGGELTQRLLPELQSADAIERATFARLVLQHLAADIDVLPEVAARLVPAFRQTLAEVLGGLASTPFAASVDEWRSQLNRIATETGVAKQREVAELRNLAATIIRELADGSPGKATDEQRAQLAAALTRLGRIDCGWLTEYEAARNARSNEAATASTGDSVATSGVAAVTAASVTSYLRRRFPGEPGVEAIQVVPIPGGRSKKTFFISLARHGCTAGRARDAAGLRAALRGHKGPR